VGGHEHVIKLLLDNGANLRTGDTGQLACTAAEQNNLTLLKEIIRYGGDVTHPKTNGTTALHAAVCEGNMEIVKFLLDQGADIDKPDHDNWTPRDLAEQQGHEDIKILFQSSRELKTQPLVSTPERQNGARFLGRFTSEPTIRPLSQEDSSPSAADISWSQSRPRRRTSNFHNSLFGIMSAAHTGEKDILFSVSKTSSALKCEGAPARVTVSCLEKGEVARKLVLLPRTFQELLEIGAKKFAVLPTKVLSKDGAEIDGIEVIRDGDHLTFVSCVRTEESDSKKSQINGCL
jgi:ankyrin repeat protein